MMTKPGITELDRCVDSRYTLVSMVAKRARMIGIERKMRPDDTDARSPKADKPVTQAVGEIANGVVSFVRSEAIEKAREYEEEKLEAISQLERDIIAEAEKSDNDKEASSVLDDALATAFAAAESENAEQI